MNDNGFLSSTVEALILASPEPLPARKLAQVIDDLTPGRVTKMVEELNERYTKCGSSFRIRMLAGGYQFYILPDFVGSVEELFTRRRKLRLTRAALETAAIVAYKQPVTKAEIEMIRGVASDGVINNLLEKKMVAISGRASTAGRPLQYSVADEFLKFFGLGSLEDLPRMSEIEELLASRESKDQTELNLPQANDTTPVKLNIADGTFDPANREDSQIIEPTESVPATGRKLVLTRSPEDSTPTLVTSAVIAPNRIEQTATETEMTIDGESSEPQDHQTKGSSADSD